MRFADRDGGTAQRWGDESRAGEFGPQGEALILELQRLRHAFDAESAQARKSRGPKRGGAEPKRQQRKPPPPPKRKRKKSRVSQAIDVCLQQIGLKAPPPPPARSQAPVFDHEQTPPPRRASPTIVPDDLLAMDLTKLAPDVPGLIETGP